MASAFDLRSALRGATLLDAAYDMGPRGRRKPAPGAEPLHWVQAGGSAAGIYQDPEDPGLWHVVVRGTMTLGHWKRDLMLRREPAWPPARGGTHRGFEQHGQWLGQGLCEVIPEGQRVNLDTHSLGSGAGVHLTVTLHRHGAVVEDCYMLGMPRPGDEEFSRWFDAWCEAHGIRVWRIVAIGRWGRQDLVTRLPPSDGGWWHVGQAVVVDRDGTVYQGWQAWEEVRAERPLRWYHRILLHRRLWWAIRAHGVGNYIRALERALETSTDEEGDPQEKGG